MSFSLQPGEALGLVGRNGSGKTTLLRLIAGILQPTSGRVLAAGRVGSLLELGAGFHPELSGRENIYLNGSIHRISRSVIREKLDEIVAFAGVESFIDLPLRLYSTGMQMRLAFAIATHIEADILLLDEVFAVGDEAFQRECLNKILEFKRRGGTIVFVSHDASAVTQVCDRALLLTGGRLVRDGSVREVFLTYRRQLSGERDPAERAAGLKEWGGQLARVGRVRLIDRDGQPRSRLRSDEPFALTIDLHTTAGMAAPRLHWELIDVSSGISVAGGVVSTGELGWQETTRDVQLRLDVEQPPFTDARLRLRLRLELAATSDEASQHHALDDALQITIGSIDNERELVRLRGRWVLTRLARSPAGCADQPTG